MSGESVARRQPTINTLLNMSHGVWTQRRLCKKDSDISMKWQAEPNAYCWLRCICSNTIGVVHLGLRFRRRTPPPRPYQQTHNRRPFRTSVPAHLQVMELVLWDAAEDGRQCSLPLPKHREP